MKAQQQPHWESEDYLKHLERRIDVAVNLSNRNSKNNGVKKRAERRNRKPATQIVEDTRQLESRWRSDKFAKRLDDQLDVSGVQANDLPKTLNKDQLDKFFKSLRVGIRMDAAARHAGLQTSQVNKWYDRGRVEAAGFYRQFYLDVEQARGTAEVTLVSRVIQAGQEPKYYRANLEILRTLEPGTYRQPSNNINVNAQAGVGINNSDSAGYVRALESVPDDEFEALAVEQEVDEE